MTQASPARIAARAAKFDPPVFAMPPAGMLSEQVDLIDFGLVLGLIHPEGSPILIAAWDGQRFRRLLPEQAAKWADEITLTPGLGPVITALRALVKRAGDIAVASLMVTEGNA